MALTWVSAAADEPASEYSGWTWPGWISRWSSPHFTFLFGHKTFVKLRQASRGLADDSYRHPGRAVVMRQRCLSRADDLPPSIRLCPVYSNYYFGSSVSLFSHSFLIMYSREIYIKHQILNVPSLPLAQMIKLSVILKISLKDFDFVKFHCFGGLLYFNTTTQNIFNVASLIKHFMRTYEST